MKITQRVEPNLIQCQGSLWTNAHTRRARLFCQKHGTRVCSHRFRRNETLGTWFAKDGQRLWDHRACASTP